MSLNTIIHHDDADDVLTVGIVQDVEPIMEQNKRLANDASQHWKQPMNRVASIPVSVIEHYRVEKGIDLMNDEAALRQFLNDPDQRVWRVRGGRV